MTISRVKPGNWGVNEVFTSTQANGIDANTAKALDKTTAGDTLAGLVQFGGNAQIYANTNGGAGNSFSGAINATAAGAIQSNASQGIQSNVASGIAPTVASGITAAVAGGIDGNAAAGIRASVAGGITTNIAGGISAGVVGGITGGIAAGIKSGIDGGIALTGTAADVITFGTPHTHTVVRPIPAVLAYATGWASGGLSSPIAQNCLLGGATNTSQYMIIPSLHDGATINWVEVRFYSTAHTPGVLPSIVVMRMDTTVGTGPTGVTVTLNSGGATTYPGPLTTASQAARYTCNQNNTGVDVSKYVYFLTLVDEFGAGAVAGNQYFAIAVNFTNITDMRFPG